LLQPAFPFRTEPSFLILAQRFMTTLPGVSFSSLPTFHFRHYPHFIFIITHISFSSLPGLPR